MKGFGSKKDVPSTEDSEGSKKKLRRGLSFLYGGKIDEDEDIIAPTPQLSNKPTAEENFKSYLEDRTEEEEADEDEDEDGAEVEEEYEIEEETEEDNEEEEEDYEEELDEEGEEGGDEDDLESQTPEAAEKNTADIEKRINDLKQKIASMKNSKPQEQTDEESYKELSAEEEEHDETEDDEDMEEEENDDTNEEADDSEEEDDDDIEDGAEEEESDDSAEEDGAEEEESDDSAEEDGEEKSEGETDEEIEDSNGEDDEEGGEEVDDEGDDEDDDFERGEELDRDGKPIKLIDAELLDDIEEEKKQESNASLQGIDNKVDGKIFVQIPLDFIEANPNQPRKVFSSQELEELKNSISKLGILQPIIVVKKQRAEGVKQYKIVAGERRYRACKMLGMNSIPAIIQTFTEQDSFEASIVENVQRQNLNPVEEAQAYKYLMDSFSYTQEQVSAAVQKSRAHVANLVRVLSLPVKVKDSLSSGQISLGHAKLLVGVSQAENLAQGVVDKNLSVRDLERLISNIAKKGESNDLLKKKLLEDDIDRITETFADKIKQLKARGIKIKFAHGKKAGTFKATALFSNQKSMEDFFDK